MADEKIIPIDSEMAVARIGKLLPQWLQFGVSHDCTLEVVVRKREEKRRLQQNALYWVLVTAIAKQMPSHMDEVEHLPKAWDEYFKQLYLGVESCVVMAKPMQVTTAHKTLGVHDFSDYLEQVFVWAAEHDVVLENQWHDDYSGTMAVKQHEA